MIEVTGKDSPTRFADIGAGRALRNAGFSDERIVEALGFLPELDITTEEVLAETLRMRGDRTPQPGGWHGGPGDGADDR